MFQVVKEDGFNRRIRRDFISIPPRSTFGGRGQQVLLKKQ